jgi:hypothetical protein
MAPKFTKVQVFAPKCSKWQGKVPQTEKPKQIKRQDAAHEPECYVHGADVETHGNAVTQNTFLKSYLNSLVYFPPVTIPVHRRLWKMQEGGVQSVECGV